jgi:hypothetical protein
MFLAEQKYNGHPDAWIKSGSPNLETGSITHKSDASIHALQNPINAIQLCLHSDCLPKKQNLQKKNWFFYAQQLCTDLAVHIQKKLFLLTNKLNCKFKNQQLCFSILLVLDWYNFSMWQHMLDGQTCQTKKKQCCIENKFLTCSQYRIVAMWS